MLFKFRTLILSSPLWSHSAYHIHFTSSYTNSHTAKLWWSKGYQWTLEYTSPRAEVHEERKNIWESSQETHLGFPSTSCQIWTSVHRISLCFPDWAQCNSRLRFNLIWYITEYYNQREVDNEDEARPKWKLGIVRGNPNIWRSCRHAHTINNKPLFNEKMFEVWSWTRDASSCSLRFRCIGYPDLVQLWRRSTVMISVVRQWWGLHCPTEYKIRFWVRFMVGMAFENREQCGHYDWLSRQVIFHEIVAIMWWCCRHLVVKALL